MFGRHPNEKPHHKVRLTLRHIVAVATVEILHCQYAPKRSRTSTPSRAQALNLLRMPIPPPGLARYYTHLALLVNLAIHSLYCFFTARSTSR